MKKKRRKTISTILILVVSVALFIAFIYIKSTNDKVVPEYTGILLAIIPALLINNIWNHKFKKKNR
jgi:amino acid permease